MGKSIFEDNQVRVCTQERTAIPILKDNSLNKQLKRIIRNTQLTGTYDSVTKNKNARTIASLTAYNVHNTA